MVSVVLASILLQFLVIAPVMCRTMTATLFTRSTVPAEARKLQDLQGCNGEPTPKAKVSLPPELLMQEDDEGPQMYSGYVNVTSVDYLFYWFAEASPDAGEDAPLLLWSNGGPGCSSMEGALTEIGPWQLYNVKQLGFAGSLSRNPSSWHSRAHLIMVDQPRFTGYSLGSGPRCKDTEAAARDILAFIQGWRALFPEHANLPWMLASESYGGRYLPVWLDAIAAHNQGVRQPMDAIKVIGVIIGNGYFHTLQDDPGLLIDFARQEGIVAKDAGRPVTSAEARQMLSEGLGYEPNPYDYRLQTRSCCNCAGYNYTGWTRWLNREDVRRALHVCGDAGQMAYATCSAGCVDLTDMDQGTSYDFIAALSRVLAAKVPVVLYYGKQDTVCHYVGGREVLKHLRWPEKAIFDKAPTQALHRVVPGTSRAGGGLTVYEFDGAGHMVPLDNPAAGLLVLDTLLATALNASVPALIQRDSTASALEKIQGLDRPNGSMFSVLTACIASAVLFMAVIGAAIGGFCCRSRVTAPHFRLIGNNDNEADGAAQLT